MTKIKTSDLRRLDVICIEEGKYLGNICDVDVDQETGRIKFLIVDQVHSLFYFWSKRSTELEIPWRDVVVVGTDVVLVKNRIWQR